MRDKLLQDFELAAEILKNHSSIELIGLIYNFYEKNHKRDEYIHWLLNWEASVLGTFTSSSSQIHMKPITPTIASFNSFRTCGLSMRRDGSTWALFSCHSSTRSTTDIAHRHLKISQKRKRTSNGSQRPSQNTTRRGTKPHFSHPCM